MRTILQTPLFLLPLGLALLAMSAPLAAQDVEWLDDFETAMEKAREKGVPVFADFTHPW